MMPLLFLCMLLLRAAVSDEIDGSGYYDPEYEVDDEDLANERQSMNRELGFDPSVVDRATGDGDKEGGNITIIIIGVAAAVVVLTVATVVSIMLYKRRNLSRQQGIYSVPTEQDKKEAI